MAERISQSQLWKIQQDYYQSLGVSAWDDATPYFITNSQVIAESYADLLIAFLLEQRLDPAEPVYILELGSGTGRFGYLLARELQRKQSYFPALASQPVCVVLSDIVEDNVQFWQQHPRMQALGDRLDFAHYWPDQGQPLYLRKRQCQLEKVRNPLVVIANYVFDSMPYDEFYLSNGGLQECLVDLISRSYPLHSGPERRDIRDVEIHRSYRGVELEGYYAKEHHQKVLEHYAQRFSSGAFLVPVAALDTLAYLRQLGPLVVITSDLGYVRPSAMLAHPGHPIALHGGCFSHMVNFHALSLSFEARLFTNRHLIEGVQTCLFSDVPLGPSVVYAFRERLDRVNAINHANELFSLVREQPPYFRAWLAFLRLNLNDPNALAGVAKKLAESIDSLTPSERQELVANLEVCWDNDYFFKGSPNVTFWLGHLYRTLGLYDRAQFYFALTVERQGPDAVLLYLQGECLQIQGQLARARKLYEQALEIEPAMPEVLQALAAMETVPHGGN